MNKGPSLNFLWLRNENYEKFTEACEMWNNKHVLAPKCLQMGYILICHYNPKSKRLEWKHIDSPVKKKFSMQRLIIKVNNKGHAVIFLDMKGPITIYFFEKKFNW